MFSTIKPKRISDEVIEQIKKMLAEGKLKKGERLLPEREMANELGISRPVLREALSALESMGIIERKKGGGAYIRRINSEEIVSAFINTKSDKDLFEDLLEIREVLESKAVEWATKRSTDIDLLRINDALQKFIKSNAENCINEDILFHLSIAAASHNEILYKLEKNIGNMLHDIRKKSLQLPGRKNECDTEHGEIFKAIKEKNVKKAVEKMVYHIRKVEDLIKLM